MQAICDASGYRSKYSKKEVTLKMMHLLCIYMLALDRSLCDCR